MLLQEKRDEAKALGISVKNSETIAQIQKKIDNHKLNENLKKGVVPKEQLDDWKKKHKVYKVEVEVAEDDVAVGYLREPKRDHKAIALSLYNQHQILETGEFLLQNCWLGGDTRLKDDEDIADSAAIQAKNIVNFLKGSTTEV